jgi:hypothetical protein
MDQQPWFDTGISGWPPFLRDDTVGLGMDAITDSTPPQNIDMDVLEVLFDPYSFPGPFNGNDFSLFERPNVGLIDFESTALAPSTPFPPINQPQADLTSPQSGMLVEVPVEQFSINTPPSIDNCTSLAASPLESLSPWTRTPDTLQMWSPSDSMAEHTMLLQSDLYCALSDSIPLGALGQGNQSAIFQSSPPFCSPEFFGNLDQCEGWLDQNLEASVVGGQTKQKLTKAGRVPMKEQRRHTRPEKCPFPQCQYFTKGFPYSKGGLDRHVAACKYNNDERPPRPYVCIAEGCLKEPKGFPRHDHLLRHQTAKHGRQKAKRGRHARK